MKSPRFLAALAMAAVLTTGVTAHAAFTEVSGSGANGQTPIQQGEAYNSSIANPAPAIEMQGDIQVDGTFTKRINNFPAPDKEGRYLRVTMPIKMDFTYDVDTHTMTSAEAVVTNNSVLAVPAKAPGAAPGTFDVTDEKIEMSIVDFVDNTKGNNTMGVNVKFVQNVAAEINNGVDDKVLLPFEVKMTSQTGPVKSYSIETIKANSNALDAVEIPARGTVKLTLDKINGQALGNDQLINNHTSLTSHNLKLKFEYKGN